MFAGLLGTRFWITAYAMLAMGLWLPGDWTWTRPGIPVFLGGILFFTSLKIRLVQVTDEARDPRALAAVATQSLFKLLLLPLVAFALARLLAPDYALGVLLTVAMPAGLSVVAFTDLYRGSVPRALLLLLATSLVSPLTVPLLLEVFSGARLERGVLVERALYICVLLATPFVLAQVVRVLAPRLVARHYERWTAGSMLSGCVLIFIGAASSRSAWNGLTAATLLAPLGLMCLASLAHLTVAMVGARLLRREHAIPFAMICLFMNNGLAVAFAARFFPADPHMLLPPILIQVPIVACIAWYGWWVHRSDPLVAPLP